MSRTEGAGQKDVAAGRKGHRETGLGRGRQTVLMVRARHKASENRQTVRADTKQNRRGPHCPPLLQGAQMTSIFISENTGECLVGGVEFPRLGKPKRTGNPSARFPVFFDPNSKEETMSDSERPVGRLL